MPLNDNFDRKVADFPEELPEILEPEIETDVEEHEATLPVPSDLDLVQRYIARRTTLPSSPRRRKKPSPPTSMRPATREAGSRLITSNLRCGDQDCPGVSEILDEKPPGPDPGR